jgi:hypothetical protein
MAGDALHHAVTPRERGRFRASAAYLRALPPYPGGKRRLLPLIFGLLDSVLPRASWANLTFADPFLGGGSVSLTAKALGFGEVIASDAAEQSALVGRALLSNSHTRLTPAAVLRLYEPAFPIDGAMPRLLERLPPPCGGFLAAAWQHLHGGTYSGVERDLVALLLVRWICRYFPLGLPTATDAHRIASGDFDRVTAPRLAHYLRRGRDLLRPDTLLSIADEINQGVMPGNARFVREDVFAFLPTVEADVVYLDPPYPATQSYERAFGLIEEFLGREPAEPSPFSSNRPPLDELLAACAYIPVLVLSVGNALLDEKQVRDLVTRHRQALRVISIPYHHYHSVASKEKNRRNREFLVLATTRSGVRR